MSHSGGGNLGMASGIGGHTPPLKGKQRMVEATTWNKSMLRWGPPHGPYLSRGAASYPAVMNQILAEATISSAVYAALTKTQAGSMVRTGVWGNTLVRKDSAPGLAQSTSVESPQVAMVTPLRPAMKPQKPALMDEAACVCGLVNCWEATRKISGHRTVGPKIALIIDAFLDSNKEF